jgi:hypothetical protein
MGLQETVGGRVTRIVAGWWWWWGAPIHHCGRVLSRTLSDERGAKETMCLLYLALDPWFMHWVVPLRLPCPCALQVSPDEPRQFVEYLSEAALHIEVLQSSSRSPYRAFD